MYYGKSIAFGRDCGCSNPAPGHRIQAERPVSGMGPSAMGWIYLSGLFSVAEEQRYYPGPPFYGSAYFELIREIPEYCRDHHDALFPAQRQLSVGRCDLGAK